MKKMILSVVTLALTTVTSYAQFTASDVFKKDEIVCYGIDFSKAKFIGQFDEGAGIGGAQGGSEMKSKWMPEWNMLMVNEQAKGFDFKKAMDKASIYYDMGPVKEDNANTDKDALMAMNAQKLSKEDAEKVVAGLGAGDKKEGIGMVWVVENFNKPEKAASYWIVFFDIKTKKVLFSEHVEGKCQGIGMRNFWGGSMKFIIKDIDKDGWASWKKKYK
jgi:hypothetical protein